MKKKTKERIKFAGIIIGAMLLIGMFVGAVSAPNVDKLLHKRNEDNLITLASIKDAGHKLGESRKLSASDITYTVSDKGVIKLEGTASADDTIVYATLKLPAGTYRFSGAPNSSAKTYELYLSDGSNRFEADEDTVISVSAETSFEVQICIYEGCEFGVLGEKLYPVIWAVKNSEDDTVVEFWG